MISVTSVVPSVVLPLTVNLTDSSLALVIDINLPPASEVVALPLTVILFLLEMVPFATIASTTEALILSCFNS